MEALGRLVDVVPGVVPVDLGTAGATGLRVHLKNAGGVAIVVYLAAGTAAQNPTFTLREHNAATSGTSQDLAVIDHYYVKAEATLDADETWTRVDNTSAGAPRATVTDANWDDANQVLAVIEVNSTSLSDGFEWVSLNSSDPGTAHLGCVLYLLRDLTVQRDPAALVNPQA